MLKKERNIVVQIIHTVPGWNLNEEISNSYPKILMLGKDINYRTEESFICSLLYISWSVHCELLNPFMKLVLGGLTFLHVIKRCAEDITV